MILCDPYALNTVALSIMKALQHCINNDILPRVIHFSLLKFDLFWQQVSEKVYNIKESFRHRTDELKYLRIVEQSTPKVQIMAIQYNTFICHLIVLNNNRHNEHMN